MFKVFKNLFPYSSSFSDTDKIFSNKNDFKDFLQNYHDHTCDSYIPDDVNFIRIRIDYDI